MSVTGLDERAAVAAGLLAGRLRGTVHLPGEPAYDNARLTFNALVDNRPALVVRCTTTDDVAAAVETAAEVGLPLSVRGGGHSVAGHGTGHGALLVDLSGMRRVQVDAERRIARVEGGALWDDVDAATQAVGLAVAGGTFGDTGVGGLTLGGGIGWLMGTMGLTCDNLVGAEVVAGTGERVVAGERGDPELLWALRGGGGNFGVVTTFEFSLRDCGPMYGGYLNYELEHARRVLEGLAALAPEFPDELVAMASVNPGDVEAEPRCRIGVAFIGTPSDGQRAVAGIRALAPIRADELGPMSYLEIQAMSGRLPFGLRHYWKGHFLRELDTAAIDAVVRHCPHRPGSLSGVLLEAITGTARRADPDSSAFGRRDATWNVSALAIWEDPAFDEPEIAWARGLTDDLASSALAVGSYLNYLSHDDRPDRALAAFGDERLGRLRAVKRRYDPDNLLRFNLNIDPRSAQASDVPSRP
jgi:FAD/FMN-containing dehydrogenase